MAKENRVVFGLKNVHYALWTPGDGDGDGTYGTPKPLPGAVSLSVSVEGDTNTFYADDIPYASFSTNGGYSGDLELATLEDDAAVDLLGYVVDDNGILLEDASAVPPTFALLFEVSSNTKPQRFAFYNCTLARPEMEANTRTDSTEPDTQTLNITMIARQLPYGDDGTIDVVKGSIVRTDESATVYDAWMTAVKMPTEPAAA